MTDTSIVANLRTERTRLNNEKNQIEIDIKAWQSERDALDVKLRTVLRTLVQVENLLKVYGVDGVDTDSIVSEPVQIPSAPRVLPGAPTGTIVKPAVKVRATDAVNDAFAQLPVRKATSKTPVVNSKAKIEALFEKDNPARRQVLITLVTQYPKMIKATELVAYANSYTTGKYAKKRKRGTKFHDTRNFHFTTYYKTMNEFIAAGMVKSTVVRHPNGRHTSNAYVLNTANPDLMTFIKDKFSNLHAGLTCKLDSTKLDSIAAAQ